MNRDVFMSLLESVILLDVVEIVPPYHNGSFHLHTPDYPSQNATTNANITSEGALLVNVCAFCGLLLIKKKLPND